MRQMSGTMRSRRLGRKAETGTIVVVETTITHVFYTVLSHSKQEVPLRKLSAFDQGFTLIGKVCEHLPDKEVCRKKG